MILFLKAVRSVWRNKKAYLSCVVLVAIAIYTMIAMGSASGALGAAAARYYKSNRLADIFANVNDFPAGMLSGLARIDGISEVQPRLVYDARALLPGTDKIIWLRLVTYDTSYNGVPLNCPNVTGNQLTQANDIWIGRSFLDIHKLAIGGSLSVIIEGAKVSLNIAGLADSPEYVYAVRDPKDLYPDNEAFGIAYISLKDMGALLNKQGRYNDLTFALENGYTFDDVKQGLANLLEPYGLTALYARKDQFSYSMLNAEVKQDTAMSYSIPILFTGIAAIVLFLMLKRVIEQERGQIGMLKAFGYSNREILLHYIMYGLVTSVAGGAIGALLGNMSVKAIIDLYTQYFTLPGVQTAADPGLAVIGMITAALFGIVGAYFGARPALKLSPADAMRPAFPPPVKSDVMKALPFLRFILNPRGSMSVRNIQRSKARSLFVTLGITFSFGILAMMCPIMTMVSDMTLSKYTRIEAYDAKLSLKKPAPASDAVQQAMKLPGVTYAEPLREIPAELRFSNRKTNAVLTGLKPDTRLYNIFDDQKRVNLPFPGAGIIINSFTAEKLGVGPGSQILITTAYNKDEIPLVVRDVVHQNMTAAAYIDAGALNGMLHLPDSADSVMVRSSDMEGLKSSLNDAKNISGIEDTYSAIVNFQQQMGAYSSMTYVMLVLGIALAFSIIYNSATISLSEKKREYATLRVLGMHIKEVCEISNFEYWTLFAAGCALGVPFGQMLLNALNGMMKSYIDDFSMPFHIPMWAYGMAFAGCMAAVMLSNMSAKRTVKRLDMVEVLKEKE